MDSQSLPRNPWFDPDLTQLPTPLASEPAMPLEEFQRDMEHRRADRLAADRKYPLLGWRNLLTAAVILALVLVWIFAGTDVLGSVMLLGVLLGALGWAALLGIAGVAEHKRGN